MRAALIKFACTKKEMIYDTILGVTDYDKILTESGPGIPVSIPQYQEVQVNLCRFCSTFPWPFLSGFS